MANKKEEGKIKSTAKSDSQRLEEGQLLVRVILEMLGAPKEHIEATMKSYIESLKESNDYEIIKTYISEAEEQEEKIDPKLKKDSTQKLYSAYAELEIWFKKTERLIAFCFDCLPSSVEILEPTQLKFNANEFSGLLNDLQAKLHKVDMAFKRTNADIKAASIVFKTLITNFIGHCLRTGKNNAEEISKVTGIEKERIQKIIDELVEKKIILKKDDTYSLVDNKL